MKVTAFDVEGKIDYDKLVLQFGVQYLTKDLIKRIPGNNLHLFLKRNLFFTHRDFDKFLNSYEKGENVFIYTGLGPSGDMHIGHLISFQFTKYLQDVFNCNVYIQLPDDEKQYVKSLSQEETDKFSYENSLDIISLGFNPNKTFIFKNTDYIKNMYKLNIQVASKINLNVMCKIFGFDETNNIGHIYYPTLQIVPTFFEEGYCLIPCGIDQDPYFRLQREIARKLGKNKCCNIHNKFLMGLNGPNGKMSSSKEETAIYLKDTPKQVKKKINKYAFSGGQPTIEEHQKYGGNTEIDVSYQYLYYLFEENDEKINQIKKDYENGKILSGEMKKLLIEKINLFLENHNKKKEKMIKNNLLEKFTKTGDLAKKMNERYY